jgi:hypothetical protein
MPDYRGNNTSEGCEFTTSPLAVTHDGEDVGAVLIAIGTIDHADARNLFMWGALEPHRVSRRPVGLSQTMMI